MKGWGPNSSVCPSKPRESNLFGEISRDLAGISRKRPKSLRKRCLGSIFGPYKTRSPSLFGGFEKGLAGGGWRQTNPEKSPKSSPEMRPHSPKGA